MNSLFSKANSIDFYSQLPKEVLSVKERIGLKSFTQENKTQLEKFLRNNIPVKNKNEELNYLVYPLQDTKIAVNKKQAKRKVNCLSSKERKKLFTITKKSKLNYSTFVKINDIWHGYIQSLIKDNTNGKELKLAKCDYHGAKLAVSASINPSLVGIVGIVVQETKNTFKLINKKNKISVIPKNGSMFAFTHNNVVYKINGSYLKMTSHLRSKIRFKSKKIVDNI